MPVQSLIRELTEELGIRVCTKDCIPTGFAESGAGDSAGRLVILLYTIANWDGEPEALEGGEVGWFTRAEALALPKPPLDLILAEQLFQNR